MPLSELGSLIEGSTSAATGKSGSISEEGQHSAIDVGMKKIQLRLNKLPPGPQAAEVETHQPPRRKEGS